MAREVVAMVIQILLILMLLIAPCSADSPFVAVFVDSKTENELGPFPYDRSVIAQATEALASLGARGVVLKFFFAEPRSKSGDDKLAKAGSSVKVLHQGGIHGASAPSNPLLKRFIFQPSGQVGQCISGTQAVLPLPALSASAWGVGFVDVADMSRPGLLPAFVCYRRMFVKSLWVQALELASNKKAVIVPGESVTCGNLTWPLDEQNQLTAGKAELESYSLVDLLRGKIPKEKIEGRIVIIGYDGEKMDFLNTPAGKMRGHRWFATSLVALWSSGKP
jgi:CHASE2 domain-containing sensor protein